MKQKRYIYGFSLLVLGALTFHACDFLDEEPVNRKDSAVAWETPADALANVNALYFGGVPYLNNTDVDGGWTPKATMWGGIISGLFVDMKKDRNFTNASENLNFNVASFDDTAWKLWHEFYKGISRANFVIANIPTMAEVLDQPTINNYLAQGKFFRAYGYFWLVKEFGDVPYVDKPYTAPVDMYLPRVPAAEVYGHIEADLSEIIASNALPDKTFYENGGYATKAMAETLLAEVYLQHAGYPLNGGQEYYEKAAKVALSVINAKVHELAQDRPGMSAFNVLKLDETTANREIIYAKEYNQSLGVGNSYPTRSVITDASQWKDINDKVFLNPGGGVLYNAYQPAAIILNSYEANDARIQEKEFFFWELTDPTGVLHTIPRDTPGNWAWFDQEALANGRDGSYNIPTFRYAEVLLIAAEALARTGHEENAVGGAKYYLNQVRRRAGLADETASGEELIAAILTERLHEFPLEFKIWDDIRRTRLYPEAGKAVGRLDWKPLSTAIIQNKPAGFTKQGVLPEYVLLWPIPLKEMQASPALQGHQNPGWN
ncbi:MAG: RagB/SusD family nutrient uptake outer membrane protein [Mediterranea sp.]|jgi:hypothetical protein|nr:RagB/SusD family nutrient uptake outer membrane protein [Mediterranea sp.]